MDPDHAAPVVIHYHRYVLVPFLVAGLVDAYAPEDAACLDRPCVQAIPYAAGKSASKIASYIKNQLEEDKYGEQLTMLGKM